MRNCGFQTGFRVTHSQKFVLHSNQNTHTYIIKTHFKEQFLALVYVAFSHFKKKCVVFFFNAGHNPLYFVCHHRVRIQFEKTLRKSTGPGQCGRRKAAR